MDINISKLTKILFLVLFINNSFAVDIIPKQSKYYYELGGGSNINLPPPTRHRTINIGGAVHSDLGYTCGGFNPSVSIKNTFNNLKDSISALQGDIYSSVTAAIGSLPLYGLAKLNPELYNLTQNMFADANESFKISMKSCETALSDIKKGSSVYEDWFSISDSQGWLDSFNSAKNGEDVDINKTVKKNTVNHRKEGIPWVHSGKSGGSRPGQVPIKVVRDIVIAGYNVLAEEESFLTRTLDGNTPAPKDSTLYKFWKTPNEAGDFARYVLGDITISTDKKYENDTHAGFGLVGIMKDCYFIQNRVVGAIDYNDKTCIKTVRNNLIEIVQSSDRPSMDKLQEIAAGRLLVTPDIIQSIRNMSDDNKKLTISKLAEDIAMQNLVEQALMLRRLLITGAQTRPVQNLKPALEMVYKTINQLDIELDNLSFESNIREKFASKTISSILNENNKNEMAAFANQSTKKSLDMHTGAIYTDEGGNLL